MVKFDDCGLRTSTARGSGAWAAREAALGAARADERREAEVLRKSPEPPARPKDLKPARVQGDTPVDLFTGEVLETREDLCMPAGEPLVFRRQYSSAWCWGVLPFGRGWTHNFHQALWVEKSRLLLRGEDGRRVELRPLREGQRRLLRGLRLEVERKQDRFEFTSLDIQSTRVFSPEKPGGPAVLRQIVAKSGRFTTLHYERGRLVEIAAPWRNSFRLEYDDWGRIVRLSLVNRRGAAFASCTYQYHPTGELARVVDGEKRETFFDYDRGHRLGGRRGGAEPAARWAYDDAGRCIEASAGKDQPCWQFRWDPQRHRAEVKGPRPLRTFLFGSRGELEAVRDENEESLRAISYDKDLLVLADTDALGRTTRFEYDARGARVSHTDPRGNTTRLVRLPNRVEGLNPEGQPFERHFDSRGRLMRSLSPHGIERRYERDHAGRVSAIFSNEGFLEQRRYNERDQFVWRQDAGGLITELRYDEWGYLQETRDSLGRHRQYPSGSNGPSSQDAETLRSDPQPLKPALLLESWRLEGPGFETKRDRAGKLTQVKRPDGTFRAWRRNSHGDVTHDSSSDGDRFYEYDQYGRVSRAIALDRADAVAVTFERDAFGRVVKETQGEHEICFEYDSEGRVIVREVCGERTEYQYDRLGRLVAVIHQGKLTAIQRDAGGRELCRQGPRQTVTIESRWNTQDQLVLRRVFCAETAHAIPPSVVVGRRVIDPPPSTGPAVPRRIPSERTFHWDASGRLTRTEDQIWGDTAEPAGQEARLNAGAKPLGPHESRDERTGSVTHYVWDSRDQLREVRLPSGERLRLVYDAFGRRVRKDYQPNVSSPGDAEGSYSVNYLWDGTELCAEVWSDGRKRVHVSERGTFVPLLQSEGDELLQVVTDPFGTPKELIDETGRVVWSVAHSTWGSVAECLQNESGFESPFRLPGHVCDLETGLHAVGHRVFDPSSGEWISGNGAHNIRSDIPTPIPLD